MAKILLVEDDANARRLLAMGLATAGHEVRTAAGEAEARQMLAAEAFDCVLTDLRMDGRDAGLDVLRAAKEARPDLPVILLTAYASAETAVAAMKSGAFDYLTKPVSHQALISTIERALAQKEMETKGPSKEPAAEDAMLVGESEAMRRVRERLLRAAKTDYTVLITGESGTGKELAARFVHRHSRRAAGPFVAVNCGAIPEGLFEAELFGHRKGAFTDALFDRKGVFEEADGGTLFLDEVGDLPASVQVKLLRALQEKCIRRVGEARERPVDVRIIAATNRDLAAEVAAGRFREDLFYRLHVLPVHIPPLRARKEDIPAIARALLSRWGEDPARLTPDAAQALMRLPLPGNVRELENLLQRVLAMAPEGERIDARLIEAAHAEGYVRQLGQSALQPSLDAIGGDLDGWLAAQERRLIELALEQTGGVMTEAAKLLGISFRSLRYRMAKLGIKA